MGLEELCDDKDQVSPHYVAIVVAGVLARVPLRIHYGLFLKPGKLLTFTNFL
jgi:hypothetical protein